ncbi:dephospho-CoA kinase [Sphingobacterium spiritivorum]|uniref:dephospho-CoA kinase n=1 Tax=Sphingobacterium spiritivorum TaxID=258 RepID=UPI00191AF944|nr:dephospho-CoA kinase [Sphingobacterium spiritivorum]QQT24821.1 dephospho-CoA kinase [Sphingobacterium spiritivorum]
MGLKIGITGGIGAGKSIICNIFKVLGVPVYNADQEAKDIMIKSEEVKAALKETFGNETYFEDGSLNRAFLSSTVFGDEAQLKLLNGIVHPAVIRAGEEWSEKQTAAYSLKEAALLFETGSYRQLDYTILVTAPEDIRIARVVARDHTDEAKVRDRISKQMSDKEKSELTDFIVINDGIQPLLPQVLHLHQQFLTF